jgi:hypothetical protein
MPSPIYIILYTIVKLILLQFHQASAVSRQRAKRARNPLTPPFPSLSPPRVLSRLQFELALPFRRRLRLLSHFFWPQLTRYSPCSPRIKLGVSLRCRPLIPGESFKKVSVSLGFSAVDPWFKLALRRKGGCRNRGVGGWC